MVFQLVAVPVVFDINFIKSRPIPYLHREADSHEDCRLLVLSRIRGCHKREQRTEI